MKNLDIFGGETESKSPVRGKYNIIKARIHYRLGTKEKCCKHCSSKMRIRYNDKTYYKCKNIGCSASEASDIRLKMVCDLFGESNG